MCVGYSNLTPWDFDMLRLGKEGIFILGHTDFISLIPTVMYTRLQA